ncbi:MAG TPA: NPCBM/NEW2 domain-containing protein [Kiritimatiellia bacterium]|nr:NPCBM/NEW2 domain-containing protein [Kiritimatiellia bacterium]
MSISTPNPHRSLQVHLPLSWALSFAMLTALLLRFVLCTWNLEANDDHIDVIRRILASGHWPSIHECWQCYHPKLWHQIVAWLVQWSDPADWATQTRIAQMFNWMLGAVELLVLLRFLKGLRLPPAIRLITFLLVAFNPRLIAITSQASNDSLAIAGGWLATACYWRSLHSHRRLPWVAGTAFFLFIAMAAKGNGLAIWATTVAWSLVHLISAPRLRWKSGLAGLALLLGAAAAAAPFGYMQNARIAGSPFAMNSGSHPFPHPFQETHIDRDGITSLAAGFGTFRWFDLLQYPRITDGNVKPEHQHSFWSQLFGRTASVRFDFHPPTWQDRTSLSLWTSRGLLLLGIIPTLLALWGVGGLLRHNTKKLVRQGWRCLAESADLYILAIFLASLASTGWISVQLRYFYSMKAIYVFPGALGAVLLIAHGLRQSSHFPRLHRALLAGLMALVTLSFFEISVLAADLRSHYVERALQPAAQLSPLAPAGWESLPEEILVPIQGESNHWGQAIDSQPLSCGGRFYPRGWGLHAPFKGQMRLDGKWKRIRMGFCACDRSPGGDGTQTTIRDEQGKILYQTSFGLWGGAEWANIPVEGLQVLTIESHPLWNNISDHVNWIMPQGIPE